MKQIYFASAIITATISILLSSCTKLDSKVYNQVTPDNFFQTPQQVNAALAQAYTPMTTIPMGNTFQLNSVSSDELVIPTRGNDWYDGGMWQALWLHNYRPDIKVLNDAWNDISNGIGKCNFLLSTVNQIPENNRPVNLDQIIAEIKVLRAYYYFVFTDLFGNVPLVTDYNVNPTTVKQRSRNEVYNFLENELTTNVPLLQDKAVANYGHINKWGGYMLLAKLYLNAQVYTGTPQWEKAANTADQVIKSGKYNLQANFFDNFIVANEGSVENIFVVPFDFTFIGGNIMVRRSLNGSHMYTYNLGGQPNNGWCAPTAFYRTFSDNDIRKKMWLIGQQYNASGAVLIDVATKKPVILSPYVNELSNPADTFKFAGARSVKYAPQPGAGTNASNDGVVYRLADAYLIKAEAQIRNGQTGDALMLINAIRKRAGLNDWTAADLTLPNILAERGRELAWEGCRRNDLIRFEVADQLPYFTGARNPGKSKDPDNRTFIFPIPANQMISNKNLVQNPGY
ncbi:RagB/SusD family nutrient uptake outer membrane protein [Chitinophaga filiformis]|uniref:RagB/SusD family nutrient uptake outer membrane protein n=1 Tax=Chitinophaga filiformis TaxID=104663 RepID=A0ABY4I1H4_CHIFI|nr:RagB/SusD family nutrient uptake outer membrane protein [Chitinophaga filiformis]UPK69023.1 RagB/SusD family nutrient uptake outer membrane protein [Chitinophaga filiformis]